MNNRGNAGNASEPICRKISPAEAGKPVDVTVTAKPGTGKDAVDFSFESEFKNANGNLAFDKAKNNMQKSDFYLIQFTLDDQSGLGLRFEPNPIDAFWVAMGDNVSAPKCPEKASHSATVFAVSAPPRGTTLTVRNDDDVVQFFRFSLGFVDRNGNPHRYDPIGQNQNGGVGSN